MSMSDSRDGEVRETQARPKGGLGFSRASWARAGREGVWVIAGQGLVAIAGLVGVRVLTELCPRAVFGEAALLTNGIMLARNVFLGPLANAQLKYYPEYARRGGARGFSRRIGRMAWASTAICAAVGITAFLGWRFLDEGGLRAGLLPILLALVLTDTARTLRSNRLSAERRQARIAAWTASEAILVVVFSACFLFFVSRTTEAYLLGQATAAVAAFLVFGRLLYPPLPTDREDGSAESSAEFARKMIGYGLPFVPLAVVSWLSNLGERYVIAGKLGAGDVGLYAAGYAVASRPLLLIGGVFLNFGRPILFQAASDGRRRAADRVTLLLLGAIAVLGGAAVLALWLLAPWVARLLLAPEYRQGAPSVFLWVSTGYALFTLVQVVELRILSLGRSGKLLLPTAISAAVNIGGALLLVPRFGYVGAAYSTAGAFAAQLVVIALTLARIRRGSEAAGTPQNRGETP